MEVIKNSNAKLFIKLDNIKDNWKHLKYLSKNKIIAASVKADSYGLGSKTICNTLIKAGCDNFFVADTKEAINLRKYFKKINIFLLNGIQDYKTAEIIIKNKIFIVLNNKYDLLIVKQYYKNNKKRIHCAIHFDTGMNRLGFGIEDMNLVVKSINNFLEPQLIMSHLSGSENKLSSSNKIQISRFKEIRSILSKKYSFKYSLANSNGIFLGKNFHFDLIRSGGLIYGLNLRNKKKKIKNVVSLKAKIIQIRFLEQGSPIGYGSKYITKKRSMIATVAIGYADGLPRNYRGHFFFKGRKVNICGNISMDLTCIDITGIKNVRVNNWVEIFGDNMPIEKFAYMSSTITYDILSSLGNRIERIYLQT